MALKKKKKKRLQSMAKKTKSNIKAKEGRPSKYEGINLAKVELFAMHGLIDSELAICLDISEATLNNYKKQHPEFLESIKKGKLVADLQVERKLYERATGYEHEDTYFSNYQGVVSATSYTKHYPPDTAAAFIWLKNRRGWRDRQEVEHSGSIEQKLRSLTDEELQERVDELKTKLESKGQSVQTV